MADQADRIGRPAEPQSLTKVQRLVIRAAIDEGEFTYFDLSDLTGRSRENLRKIKNELNARFPDILISTGQDEAVVGRKSNLWRVNPKHLDTLRELAREPAAQRNAPPIEIAELPILDHARELLMTVHSAPKGSQLDMVTRAQELIVRARTTFDDLRQEYNGQISPVLQNSLELAATEASRIGAGLTEMANSTGQRILRYTGDREMDGIAGAAPGMSDPDRSIPLDDMVSHVCHAPPNNGRENVFEFGAALIASAEDPDAADARKTIVKTMNEPTFCENVCDAFGTILRDARRADTCKRVARRLLAGMQSIGLAPNVELADQLEAVAGLEGLEPDLSASARQASEMFHPRGALAGHEECQPFSLSANAHDVLSEAAT